MTTGYQVRKSRASDEEWDRRVAEAGGNAFQSSSWGHVEQAFGSNPVPIEVLRGDDVIGVGMASAGRSRIPLLGRFRDRLLFPTPPVLEAGHTFPPVFDALSEFARRERFAFLKVGSMDSLVAPNQMPVEHRDGERLEFRVSLAGSMDDVLSRMSSSHRRNIRKARKEGFEFVEDSTMEGAMELRSLQDDTFERREELGHTRGSAWERDGYRRAMRAYLDAGAIHFWFAVLESERLSGLGVLRFGDRAYYLVGGTSTRGYQCGAAFAAFDGALNELVKRGIRVLNLGGTPPEAEKEGDMDHGLFRFKRSFGSEIVRLSTLQRRV